LRALQTNPIKVNLLPLDFTAFHRQAKEDELVPDEIKERLAEFSGRVVYALENYTEAELDTAGELCFTCGPETTDGWLDDSEDLGCYDKLKKLFADFPMWDVSLNLKGVSIGAAENFHEVEEKALAPHGITFKDVWPIIKARLERSGAVPYEGGGGG
jgi:hypothetical protein